MPNPLVTVYLVNHNYSRFLGQSIESVLNQSFADFELIVIDDGSTDNSREVIERYKGDPRITPIFQHNKGLNITNNIALRSARGKYIMRLDADDWLDQNALQVLSGVLDREPNVGLVFPDYFTVDEHGTVIDVIRRHNFDAVTLHDQPAHGACTMARTENLREIGGYDESFRCQDGYDIWLRFIRKFEVRNVNLPLFYYRQHGASLTRNEGRILDTRSEIIEKRVGTGIAQRSALAIIPVRGTSVDPRSLALRDLGGKPLVDWTIDAALGASRICDTLVTTPDEQIIEHVKAKYGNRVATIKRDSRIAQINSYLDATLQNAIEEYIAGHEAPGAIVELFVESPFRNSKQIDTAVNVLELFSTDCVIGVRPETDVFYRHNGHGLQPVRSNRTLRLESDELFREVGDIRVARYDWIRSNNDVPGGRIGHVVLDQEAAFCIMTEWDWEIAQQIAVRIAG